MTTCNDDSVQREIPELVGGGDVQTANPDDAVLARTPADLRGELTMRSELDVHAAITGGLAAYLMQQVGAIDGRSTELVSVISDWADFSDSERGYPAAAVHSEEVGKYTGLGPTPAKRIAGAQVQDLAEVPVISSHTNYELEELMVGVMCNDKIMRTGVRRMLERAFNPVTWTVGFKLRLPRYHNAIAQFLAVSAQQPDSEDQVKAGLRPLVFRLRASCPVYQVHTLPTVRPIALQVDTAGNRLGR